MTSETKKELHEGVNGSGNTTWMVVTVSQATGQWDHIEHFSNKAEAENWMTWA